MGLNMNYSLLMEGSDSVNHIPTYGKYYNPSVVTEEYLMEAISVFNQEIRETSNYLDSLCETCSLNEAFSVVDIANGIKSAVEKVRKALRHLYDVIVDFLFRSAAKIREIVKNVKERINSSLTYYEKVTILKKQLNEMEAADKTIQVADLTFTQDLLDPNFPDTKVLYDGMFIRNVNDLFNTAKHANNDFWHHGEVSQLDNAVDASNTIRNNIMNDRSRMLMRIFRNYHYDDTNVLGSADEVAQKAFGSVVYSDTVLTSELYMKANDCVEKATRLSNEFDAKAKEYNNVKNDLIRCLDQIDTKIDDMFKMANPQAVNLKPSYFHVTNQICSVLREAMHTLRLIADANDRLIIYKVRRINSIIASSEKIIIKSESIIARSNRGAKLVPAHESEVFYGRENSDEFVQIQEDFNVASVIISEMYNENKFNDCVISAINEAEGDNNDQQQQQQTAQVGNANNNTNQNGLRQKAGNAIASIEALIGRLAETFKRFKARVEEVILKNVDLATFWKKNRDRIQTTPITDTKLNDWYNYKIGYFRNSVIIPFDPTSKDLESDEAFQEAIMKKITGGATIDQKMFGEKDTFSQKINKIYQGEYKNNENGEGMPANTIGYDHKAAFDYVDSFVTKGFESDTLANVGEDYKLIDNTYKRIKNNPDQYAQKITISSNTQQTAQANADNTKSEPQNASAIETDDFRFNLAEQFGLTQYHEASFGAGTVDQNIQKAAGGNGEESEKDKQFSIVLRRWFNLSTVAITAKMTAAMGCYKQYMSLFKFVYGGKQQKNTEENPQQQEQQNQQPQNNEEQK